MNRWQAQYEFWSSFDLPAFNEQTSIDEDEEQFPHLTYEATGGELDQMTQVQASLWYKSDSWEAISLKADEIETAIGTGLTIPVDNGVMWVHKSNTTPFAQPVDSGYTSSQVKRINLTVEIEFLIS